MKTTIDFRALAGIFLFLLALLLSMPNLLLLMLLLLLISALMEGIRALLGWSGIANPLKRNHPRNLNGI